MQGSSAPSETAPASLDAGPAAARMRAAAAAFLATLTAAQQAVTCGELDDPGYRDWTYKPGPRPGLALEDMSDRQRDLAFALLATALSPDGLASARSIMALEPVLRDLEKLKGDPKWPLRGEGRYWFRVLGQPTDGAPWAWRVNGHHLAIHVALAGDQISVTPQFFGANPATHLENGTTVRTLLAEDQLGFQLLAQLTPEELGAAVTSHSAPWDLATRHDPLLDSRRVPTGLRYADMAEQSRTLLVELVEYYLGRSLPPFASAAWQTVVDAGLDQVSFSWAGSFTRDTPHYYSVLGPTFLLEYATTNASPNHVHTVWRDAQHDWGDDILAAHYAREH
jgi:hypothetical protein